MHQQFFAGLGVKLRVRAQEVQKFGEGSFKSRLFHRDVHFCTNAGHFALSNCVNFIGAQI